MATKTVYNLCLEHNKLIGCREFHTGSYEPDLLFFFGENKLVEESELEGLSESERCYHLNQDRILREVYIENYSDVKIPVKSAEVTAVH